MYRDKQNHLGINEYQHWMEKGRNSRDGAYGLLFYAADLAMNTDGEDKEIPIALELAKITMLGGIAETLDSILAKLEDTERR